MRFILSAIGSLLLIALVIIVIVLFFPLIVWTFALTLGFMLAWLTITLLIATIATAVDSGRQIFSGNSGAIPSVAPAVHFGNAPAAQITATPQQPASPAIQATIITTPAAPQMVSGGGRTYSVTMH
ncbi:alkaline shock response membrane anchor protein AmaP [Candidatus Saccharibacteria bacterium]|nr:alkaline shock response membrane anchor protein AmaP [Candidatus Saccharibacteria bacterium]